jgi:hypothetical protein
MSNKLNLRRIVEKWAFAWYEVKTWWKIEDIVINVCIKV